MAEGCDPSKITITIAADGSDPLLNHRVGRGDAMVLPPSITDEGCNQRSSDAMVLHPSSTGSSSSSSSSSSSAASSSSSSSAAAPMQHRRRTSADAGVGHRRHDSSGGGVDGAPQHSPPHGSPPSQTRPVLVEASETDGDNAVPDVGGNQRSSEVRPVLVEATETDGDNAPLLKVECPLMTL